MKLRYQLMLAFFLFAVVPLAALTLYSYRSSTQAVRKAVEAETGRMAEEMENRMTSVTSDLARRIEQLRVLPAPTGVAPAAGTRSEDQGSEYVSRWLTSLGRASEYLDSLEIAPLNDSGEADAEDPEEPAHPEPPAPPRPAALPQVPPIVIELPRILSRIEREAKDVDETAMKREDVDRLVQDLTRQLGEGAREIGRVVHIRLHHDKERHVVDARPASPHDVQLRLGREFGTELRSGDRPVGRLRAKVSGNRLVREVLRRTQVQDGEIPFVQDAEGKVYTPDPDDLPKLEAAHLTSSREHPGVRPDENWVVVKRDDPSTGLVFGLAHPVGESLREIRRASVRNLMYGLGMSILALLGILPLSHRITRNLTDVSRGAGLLAAGDLDVQVPVRSNDELGHLARAFNQMAARLKGNQERLIAQERLQKELEMCRKIQNELLPRAPMRSVFADVQGVSIPARELGGDFFNYFDLPGGEIALLMGDVSGKGVPAALLMANLQATLRARLPVEPDLASFADKLDHEVEEGTATQVYLTLFLSILDPARHELRYVNAGHQSPFVVRKDGRLDCLDSTGRPIGLLAGRGYEERRVSVGPGDGLFLYTDGLVDAENPSGECFGMDRLASVLARGLGEGSEAILARVGTALVAFRGGVEAPDDAAMLMLRVGGTVSATS